MKLIFVIFSFFIFCFSQKDNFPLSFNTKDKSMENKTHSINRIINTNSDRVFKVVSDFKNYEKWNSIIPSAKGEFKEGARLNFRMKIDNKIKPFKPKVISIKKGESFTVSKIIISKGVGELTHHFEFKSLAPDKMEFIQTWTGKGWLVKMMWPKISKLFPDFEIFTDDLVKYLEKTE